MEANAAVQPTLGYVCRLVRAYHPYMVHCLRSGISTVTCCKKAGMVLGRSESKRARLSFLRMPSGKVFPQYCRAPAA